MSSWIVLSRITRPRTSDAMIEIGVRYDSTAAPKAVVPVFFSWLPETSTLSIPQDSRMPAIGVLTTDFTLRPNDREVAEVFEVPLRFLMTVENHEFHERTVDGQRRDYYAIPYEERNIWGVTAGILRSLYELLYSAERA